MGSGKKEAARKVRQGKIGDGMANVKTKVRAVYTEIFFTKLTFTPGREFLP
jgi:hypothetical protein